MKRQQKHNDAGFTIIEVMIAIMVFAIGALSIARLQVTAMDSNAHGRRLTEAAALGSGQIEQIQSWDYADTRLLSTNNNTYTLSYGSTITSDGHQADPSGRFDICWDVIDDWPATNSKRIDIKVYWRYKEWGPGGAMGNSYTLSTVKSS